MRISAGIAAVAATLLVAVHAFADAGKVGQWRVETQSSISDPKHILIDLPPAMSAAIRERGNTATIRYYCMDAASVAASRIFVPGSCTVDDTEADGQTLTAAYQCTGDNPGKGHVSITYDKPEHYSGEGTFTPADGGGLKVKSRIEGTWLGDACSSMH